MPVVLVISPHGSPFVEDAAEGDATALAGEPAKRTAKAFALSPAAGLLHLATAELQSVLPQPFAFARDLARDYLTALCHVPVDGTGEERSKAAAPLAPLPPPAAETLADRALRAPPMKGLEYLSVEALARWWTDLDVLVRSEASAFPGGPAAYLREKNPAWRLVGRVTFHLAENPRDPDRPFAFMATYAGRLSAQGKPQHLPLGRALQEHAGAKDRPALLALLTPVQRAAERVAWVRELADSGDVYHPLAWSAAEAYQFLRDLPALEDSGLIVRVPDWWKADKPPRPSVSVRIGGGKLKTQLSAETLLDFKVDVSLGGQILTATEIRDLLAAGDGLVSLKGKWVEVDRQKLSAALDQWKAVERDAEADGGVTFFEGMRLLSGLPPGKDAAGDGILAFDRQWAGVSAGPALADTLRQLREPAAALSPAGLNASLRPYQQTGAAWLAFLTRLGLGACLADDMGLGKTVQVLALLLHRKREADVAAAKDKFAKRPPPTLLVVPASLIGNWKAEAAKFAPSLSVYVAHPSEPPKMSDGEPDVRPAKTIAAEHDLVITTYSMLARLQWVRDARWGLVVLDEAQAIKNAGSRQARAAKDVLAAARIALTGTPVENRLSDLWSLFDFLNPGLLGSARAFAKLAKRMADDEVEGYAPLRSLVKPYVLRRLKTDRSVIADLPDKTEIAAFCGLSKKQAVMYEQAVVELAEQLASASEGIQRKGLVLAYLTRFKQVCNHPSQWTDDGTYDPADSGKFGRLAEICQELAERQERALVFTQFREMTAPLAAFLQTVFGRPGLVLHGQIPVAKRRGLVEAFQKEDGPPFFVLSVKAGGTGLNLTAASHVIHFDRWWNPAVESQATDRAFRIGQKRNVLVHKFVCRGTIEERIDQLIVEKADLARDLLGDAADGEAAGPLLTEMSDEQLLKLVSLDAAKAIGG